MQREGVELDRSTLADWVGGASRTLRPLVDALRRYVFSCEKVHGDDVPVPVLEPGKGKTQDRALVDLRSRRSSAGSQAAPAVWFAYSPDRKGEHPTRTLKRITEAYCKPMAMRASTIFMKRVASRSRLLGSCPPQILTICTKRIGSPVAKEALERIAQLYAIENDIRGRSPAQRREVRRGRDHARCSRLCTHG